MSNDIFKNFCKTKKRLGENLNSIEDNFKEIVNSLNSHSVNYWITFGTLLGVIRDNDFIPYDEDIDFGVYYSEKNKLDEVIKELKTKDFIFLREDKIGQNCANGSLISIGKNHNYIDFYLFNVQGENIRCGDFKLNKDQHKIKSTKFKNLLVNIPELSESYLKQWYGNNWKTPIKNKPAKPI